MLTDRDSAALVAFDAEPRTLLPLQGAQAFREAVARPWPAQPKGGTRIAPALEAAVAQLESASAQRRIIVLVTDGFVDQQPDSALEARLTRAQVELIALGVGPDADMAALARLVPPERGTILRVAEAAELPVMMRQGLENRRAPIERGRIAVRAEAPLPFQPSVKTPWPTVAAYDCHDAGAASPRPPRIRARRSADRIRAGGARTGGGGDAWSRHVVAGLAAMGGLARACRWTGRMGFIVRNVVRPACCRHRSPSDAARRCRRRQRRQVVERRLGTGARPASVRAHHRHTAGDVRRGTLERRDRRTGGRSLHASRSLHRTRHDASSTCVRRGGNLATGGRIRKLRRGCRPGSCASGHPRLSRQRSVDCRRPRGIPIAQ